MNPQNATAQPPHAPEAQPHPRPQGPPGRGAGSARRRAAIAALPLQDSGESGPSRLAILLQFV